MEDSQKFKIMMDNLPAIFSKEIEKFIKSIEDIKEDMNGLNQKLISLVEKLENSIQQYGKKQQGIYIN